MSTDFDFFEGAATIQSTAPKVTVRKSGQLVLTEAAVAFLGKNVTHVQIGFNAKTRAIGIRAAQEGGRGVYRLRGQPNGRSRLVDARRVFEHHGLVGAKARGVDVEDYGGGIVGFRLPPEASPSSASAAAKATERRRPADAS